MPFVGDDLAQSAQLQGVVITEVEKMEEYNPRAISSTEFPETLGFHPDEPPDPWYPGETPYVLTGEYYFDTEGLEHFQLWLWNSSSGSLVYTDELVAEDIEEAKSYLPALVSWVFSKIPKAPAPPEVRVAVDLQGAVDVQGTVTEAPAAEAAEVIFPRLYLGLRGGASFSAYYSRATGVYDAGMSQGFGGEVAFLVAYRPWQFFSLQTEVVFALDRFRVFSVRPVGNENLHTTSQFTSMSVLVPLMAGLLFEAEGFNIALNVGAYLILPLGQTADEGAAYTYRVDFPLGLMGGVNLGFALGPGEIFGGLRYDRDLGMTIVQSGLQYSQSRISFSVGYRFGFLKKKSSRDTTRALSGTGTVSGSGSGTGGGAGVTEINPDSAVGASMNGAADTAEGAGTGEAAGTTEAAGTGEAADTAVPE